MTRFWAWQLMKFVSFHDPRLRLLFENDDIIALDKPYGLDSHTNDSKTGNEGYVVPGLIEIFEAQLGRKLHIVHRLDRTTTGVIVFGKSLESAKVYQQFFRNRESKKTYVFVTESRSGRADAVCAEPIFHKGAQLEALTHFRRLKTGERFQLWEAEPKTGRNHQIRIHGAQVGLPLLGDAKYGGAPFPFLCLHNRKLEFPNGVKIESQVPRVFENLSLLGDRALASFLHEIDWRERLYGSLDDKNKSCLRLYQSEMRDVVLDSNTDGSLLLTWGKHSWTPTDERLISEIASVLKRQIQIQFTHPKLRASGTKIQTPYADQYLQRKWVADHVKTKSVLVAFAAAGDYATAAAQARELTIVDTSKAALNSARAQMGDAANVKFLNRETLAFLNQCKTKSRIFDLIVCDVPTFARGEARDFKIERDLREFLEKAFDRLAPSGCLLFSTSSPTIFAGDLRRLIENVQTGLAPLKFDVSNIQSALDCDLPGQPSQLKSFLVHRLPQG